MSDNPYPGLAADAFKQIAASLNQSVARLYTPEILKNFGPQFTVAISPALEAMTEHVSQITADSIGLIREAMQRIVDQTLEDRTLAIQNIARSIESINWEALDDLDDDDQVPIEISQPIMSASGVIEEQASQQMSKADFFAVITSILTIVFSIFGSPHDWYVEQQQQIQTEELISALHEATETSKQSAEVNAELARVLQDLSLVLSKEGSDFPQECEIEENLVELVCGNDNADQESSSSQRED